MFIKISPFQIFILLKNKLNSLYEQVWAVRIALLTKLRMYSVAEAECQQFAHMDSPELHFEFHYKQYPGRTGKYM